MKTIKILLLLFLSATAANAIADKDEYTREYSKEVSVDSDALLVIENKYGEVHCQNWDESMIKILVVVTVEASSDEKANRVFDKINIELSGNRSKVEGITSLSGSFNNVEFSIDYNIMMPASVGIDIDHKFGELYIEEVGGPAEINLSYGEAEIIALNSDRNDLIFKFSEAEVGYVKQAMAKLSYSEMDFGGSDYMDIESQFSEVTIEAAGKLDLDSKYDEYNIGRSGEIRCRGRFSEIDLEHLKGDFNFDLQYGDLEVYRISAFQDGYVENSFSEIELQFDEELSFRVDAELSFGDLDYPGGRSHIQHKEIGYTTNNYKGVVGTDENPSATLIIRGKNGGVTIK